MFRHTLLLSITLTLGANTAFASDVITPDSISGQNIKRAADYVEKTLGDRKLASKIRQQLKQGKYYKGSVDGNAETSCLNNTTIHNTVVRSPVNGGTLCESTGSSMDLFITLVRVLFHEMVHVDQNFLTFINVAARERDAWEETMAVLVKWTGRLWASYKELDPFDVCARREALEALRSMIRVARSTHTAYLAKDYAWFVYWWNERLEEINSYSVKVETELLLLNVQSSLECLTLTVCAVPEPIVGDPNPIFGEALESAGLRMCTAELLQTAVKETTSEPEQEAQVQSLEAEQVVRRAY